MNETESEQTLGKRHLQIKRYTFFWHYTLSLPFFFLYSSFLELNFKRQAKNKHAFQQRTCNIYYSLERVRFRKFCDLLMVLFALQKQADLLQQIPNIWLITYKIPPFQTVHFCIPLPKIKQYVPCVLCIKVIPQTKRKLPPKKGFQQREKVKEFCFYFYFLIYPCNVRYM